MSIRNLFTVLALSAVTMSGCAYKSFYRVTNNDLTLPASKADEVKVYKQKEDITSEHVELGLYRGHAPTTDEAMDTAKAKCAEKGGDFLILNTPPFKSGNVIKIDAVCAAEPIAVNPDSKKVSS